MFIISNSRSLREKEENINIPLDQSLQRFEMHYEGNKIIVFDKISGRYWSKFESSNEGPTYWTKSEELMIEIRKEGIIV